MNVCSTSKGSIEVLTPKLDRFMILYGKLLLERR